MSKDVGERIERAWDHSETASKGAWSADVDKATAATSSDRVRDLQIEQNSASVSTMRLPSCQDRDSLLVDQLASLRPQCAQYTSSRSNNDRPTSIECSDSDFTRTVPLVGPNPAVRIYQYNTSLGDLQDVGRRLDAAGQDGRDVKVQTDERGRR